MEQKERMRSLKKELDQLEKEIKKSEQENENQKKKLANEIKNLDKNIIFRPQQTEIKYTLWQRIMKALGKN
jgi:predicted  nucleic acid-binding Zn-ribbon protein